MDPKLYKAAKEGNIEHFEDTIRGSRTQMGNNVLHIAAKYGHVDFVRVVLENWPDMAKKRNSRGNTPLHLAARNGHEEVVKLIISKFGHIRGSRLMEGPKTIDTPEVSRMEDGGVGSELKQLLRMANKEGNTALHEALGNGKAGVGLVLWEEDHELVGVVNEVKEGPLYICAEWGFDTTLKRMANYLVEQCKRGDDDLGKQEALQQLLDAAVSGPDGQNPLHAAVIAGSHECTKCLIDFETSICFPFNVCMMNKPNEMGRTPLHFTAAIVKDKLLARYLLQGGLSPSYMKDDEGRTPLLQAAESGNLIVLKEILEHCPDAIEICDNEGRNAMHLTLYGGTLKPKQICKVQELIELVNEPDNEGVTPLHMAAKNQSYRMFKTLIRVGANIRAKNANGKTAWDICQEDWPASEKKKYLYNYLKYFTIRKDGKPQKWKFTTKKSSPLDEPKADLKGMANSLSMVAVLIATLTFAAAFTLPGGYESSDNHNDRNSNGLMTRIVSPSISPSPCTFSDGPHDDKHSRIGESILIHKPSLQAFIVADVLAVTCSLTVVFILISSMLADAAFLRSAIVYSKKLLYIALGGTMVAFMTGLYTVTSGKKLWVAIGVCIMGTSIPFVIAYFRRKSFTSSPIILHHVKRSMTRRLSLIFRQNTRIPTQTFNEAVAEEKKAKGHVRLPKSPWYNKNAAT